MLDRLGAILESDPVPKRLADFSPAWRLLDAGKFGVLVSFDLSLTTLVRLQGVDPTCRSDGDLEAVSTGLAQLLAACPAGTVLRTYSVELAPYAAELERYVAQFEPDSFAHHLAREKAAQCGHIVAPRKRELFLAISTPPEFSSQSYASSALGFREKRMVERARSIFRKRLRTLETTVTEAQTHLTGSGIATTTLGERDLFDVLWRLANPMRSACFAPPRQRKNASLRSQLFLSGLYNDVDFFKREDHFLRVVSLSVLPEAVSPACIQHLQGFDFPHVTCTSLRRLDTQKATAQLDRWRKQAWEFKDLLGKIRGQKASELPEHNVEAKQSDANDALALLERGDAPCEIAIQVLVTATSKDQLDTHTLQVLAAFRALSHSEAAVEEYRSRGAYLGMLPGHHALVGDRYQPILASRAADLVPVFAPPQGAANPSYLLTTPQGSLFGWHPFDTRLSSHNATIAASTGKGKSVTVRLLQLGFLANGGHGIIITQGEDYHRLADILGGEAHDVSLSDTTLALGPFASAEELELDGPDGPTRLAHLQSILTVLCTEQTESLSRPGRHIIFEALQSLYDRTAPSQEPVLGDFYSALAELEIADEEKAQVRSRMLANLGFWATGPYARMFARNRPPIEPSLSVWNLKPIADQDLRGVVLALLSGVVLKSITKARTIVTLDECWKLLQSPQGQDLAISLWRTIRHEGSAVWGISQSIFDFDMMSPETREAILNNTTIKIFLRHANADQVNRVATTFGLNEAETERLATLNSVQGYYSDLLLFLDEHHQALQLPVTGTELWMSTSDKQDVKVEERVQQRYPKHSRQAIVRALARRFPHGAAHGPVRKS